MRGRVGIGDGHQRLLRFINLWLQGKSLGICMGRGARRGRVRIL